MGVKCSQSAGKMDAGEARRTRAAIGARQRGSNRVYLAHFTLVIIGALLSVGVALTLEGVTHRSQLDPGLAAIIGAGLGSVTYTTLGRPFVVRRFRKNMVNRGLDTRWRHTLTLTDDVLILEAGSVRQSAEWSAVTELFKVREYWIFLVQMSPWFAPRRFFLNVDDEKSFVRSALSHMSEDARTRSKDAVAFAAP